MDRENGKRRVRFRDRRAGFSVYLTGTPWSDDFMRQYAAALEGVKAKRTEIASPKRTSPGTINALCVFYYRSPDFQNLKPTTQTVRRNILERFRAQHGDKPVRGLARRHINDIIGARANTPMAANNLLKVLKAVLDHAVACGMIEVNPAIGVKRYRAKGEGHHTWSEGEIARFQARHSIDTRPGLALALLLFTAQRRGDVIRMGRQHVTGDLIAVRQEKTDTPLMIPLHPDLMRALAALPRTNMTFLVTEHGAPFTSAGFGNWFRDRCNEAGLKHCSAHGLRKAAATRLANLGCSNEQIKAITGHRSDASLAPYTRAADQVRLARQAMAIQIGSDGEQKMVQQQTHAGPKRG